MIGTFSTIVTVSDGILASDSASDNHPSQYDSPSADRVRVTLSHTDSERPESDLEQPDPACESALRVCTLSSQGLGLPLALQDVVRTGFNESFRWSSKLEHVRMFRDMSKP